MLQHAHTPQLGRQPDHEIGLVHELVGHELVTALDAAVNVVAGHAEVLPTGSAGSAPGEAAGPSNHRHHEIAPSKPVYVLSDLDHLCQ